MGACWIHGSTSDHPITELAKKYSLQIATTDDDEIYGVAESTGKEYTETELEDAWNYLEQVDIIISSQQHLKHVYYSR